MSSSAPTSSPNVDGYFGEFGGAYVSETLVSALDELTDAFYRIVPSPDFQHAFNDTCKRFIGRPTPLLYAENLSKHAGGARIYLKREDLNHTGAHKINNALGQMLLASAMGKRRIIAETGAGQHGVAAATVAARFGVPCVVYMGAKDVARQEPNVARMRLLGADVVSVTAGAQTLKDALNEAMRDWVTNVDDTFYIIGTAAGPHPYPLMVREFVSVIGRETREQIQADIQQLPDAVVACVGGGSNAIGIFSSFIDDSNVALIGVEAGGRGITLGPDHHAAPLTAGTPGILHGSRSFFLQDEHGQICEGHSISAGLDYPGVGPEHAWLKTSGRASYVSVDDDEAVAMFHLLTRLEGIMPALESSHAVAYAYRLAQTMRSDQHIVVNLSGRGDKDMASVAAHVARKHNDN